MHGPLTPLIITTQTLFPTQPISTPQPETTQTHRVPALMGKGDHSPPPPPNATAAATTTTTGPPPAHFTLYKHNSWSPDIVRDEEWLRRKDRHKLRQNQSVTDEDIDELKACIELGFGFNESNDRLSRTLPALELYYDVNKRYKDTMLKSSSSRTSSDSSSSLDSTHVMFGRGDDPRIMKTRLRQWAQVVACSVRQLSSSPPLSSL